MKDIAAEHRAEFEESPEFVVAAPACLTLLGEHTEHSEGLLLGVAVSMYVNVAISPRKDNILRFYALDYNERKRTSVPNLKFKKEDRWANYIKGAVKALYDMDIPQHGFNFTVSGAIPQSIGLASSTALTVASAFAVKSYHGLAIPDEEMIDLVVDAEEEYSGKPASPADAFCAYLSRNSSCVSTDMKTRRSAILPLELGDYSLVVTDSKVRQSYAESELASRAEDERKFVQAIFGSASKTLRTVNANDIDEAMGTVPELWRRRSLHVVEEIQRVKEGQEALARGDLAAFGRLLYKSQQSLRNLYEVSCPEVDWLVKRAMEIDGVLGTRIVGKGFGGCTVAIMNDQALEEYRKRVEEYERIFGFKASVSKVEAVSGVRVLV